MTPPPAAPAEDGGLRLREEEDMGVEVELGDREEDVVGDRGEEDMWLESVGDNRDMSEDNLKEDIFLKIRDFHHEAQIWTHFRQK